MHADRTNRLMLTLVGLLALAAGGGAMAASTGVFGAAFSRRTLLDNLGRPLHRPPRRLALARRGGRLPAARPGLPAVDTGPARLHQPGRELSPSPGDTDQGTTILQPAALTDALTREIGAYHGVDAAKGRVIGDGRNPEIVLTVTPSPSADLHALHRRIETEALAHARRALGKPSLRLQLDLV